MGETCNSIEIVQATTIVRHSVTTMRPLHGVTVKA